MTPREGLDPELLERLRARARELTDAAPETPEERSARLEAEEAHRAWLADLPRRRLADLGKRFDVSPLLAAPEIERAGPVQVELADDGEKLRAEAQEAKLRTAVQERVDADYPTRKGDDRTQNRIMERFGVSARQVRRMEQKLDPDWKPHNSKPSR